jgi:hypothetical protein
MNIGGVRDNGSQLTVGEASDLRAFEGVPWPDLLGKALSYGFDPSDTITSRSQLVQFILGKAEEDQTAPPIQDWIEAHQGRRA